MYHIETKSRERAEAYVTELREVRGSDTAATIITYSVALDAHEPTRSYGYGHAVATTVHPNAGNTPVLVIWRDGFGPAESRTARELHRDVFLVDDGRTVVPHYVAGYGEGSRPNVIFLRPFPTNLTADGGPIMRADRPEQVDFSDWMLGPRRAWHLKVGNRTDV